MDYEFKDDKYEKRNSLIYLWLLCSKKLGIIRDMRMSVAKQILKDYDINYNIGEQLISTNAKTYFLREDVYNMFNLNICETFKLNIWETNGCHVHVPCKICKVPCDLLDMGDFDNIIKIKCFRHGNQKYFKQN